MEPVWSVALPPGAEPPYEVWVNGEPRSEGEHYTVDGRWLRFTTPLKPKVRTGARRWATLLAGIGVYGDLKADSVDVQFLRAGRRELASDLPVIPPEQGAPEG